ncbi:HPr family phosphocarrier protein [Yinghuangia seranimata]|uniref:HPr family phosphocarrier protein n=1 Tax=Yinghuangia seranimata TaxID=408067 RepID=UPI00248ADFD6|nr:HPr family phosphocarrier protein [Yinghuangia seranimata]MDI2130261.1 HPr family phosphocarrier protein [Yinghuangia seranimata]
MFGSSDGPRAGRRAERCDGAHGGVPDSAHEAARNSEHETAYDTAGDDVADGAACAEDVLLGADLHLRPAGAVVRAAAVYAAEVRIEVGERTASASSVLAVTGLAARAGTRVTVRGRGPDAAAAVRALAALLRAPG